MEQCTTQIDKRDNLEKAVSTVKLAKIEKCVCVQLFVCLWVCRLTDAREIDFFFNADYRPALTQRSRNQLLNS